MDVNATWNMTEILRLLALTSHFFIVKTKVFGHSATTLTEGQTGPAFA